MDRKLTDDATREAIQRKVYTNLCHSKEVAEKQGQSWTGGNNQSQQGTGKGKQPTTTASKQSSSTTATSQGQRRK
jgi:hypothetical protein